MREILLPINKVLAKEYYRLNTGFFLLVITLTFGFMSGIEHRALAEFFISSLTTLSIPAIAWLIYFFKIVNFNRNQVLLPQNQFLYTISLLSLTRQLTSVFLIVAAQFMPAILYGSFLIIMALKNNLIIPTLSVPGIIFLFLILGTAALFRQLNRPVAETRISQLKKFLDYRIAKPLIQFYLEWIIRYEPALIFGTKLFSALLIFAAAQLYEGEAYDVRLMGMTCTLAFSANFMIISRIHYFENKVFPLVRTLPLARIRRTMTFSILFVILCLPEISILIKYFPVALSWIQMPVLILYGASIGVLFYGSHFIGIIQQKNFERLIFALLIVWILLILFRIPILIITSVNSAIGVWLVKSYFYRFEWSDRGK